MLSTPGLHHCDASPQSLRPIINATVSIVNDETIVVGSEMMWKDEQLIDITSVYTAAFS